MNFQVPDYIRSLVPYVPGKPIEETQREFKLKKVIKLASNENPLGPSPKAKSELAKGGRDLHRYPDGSGFHLKKALSKKLGVETSHLILGNGSNDVIDHVIRTYCLPGDAIAVPKYSFIAYKISAQVHGVQTLEAPVDENFKTHVNDLISLVRSNEKVRVVFLANPNNPTGSYLNSGELQTLLQGIQSIRNGSVLVVLDYAYWEYVFAKDLPDALPLLKKYSNLIVLRTFSKVYGLAGLRLGYGVSSTEIISHLEKVRQPFNINSLALSAAVAALSDAAFVKKSFQNNRKEMLLWEKNLKKLGIPFWKSQGNFFLIDVQKGFNREGFATGGEVFEKCLRQGVIFRPVTNYGLPHALRISIGTPSENKKAIQVLTQLKKLSVRGAKE